MVSLNAGCCFKTNGSAQCLHTGLHNLFHPTIRDGSTWSKFGAHGEHGDVFLFSNLGALWFSENLIRYSLHVCLREVRNNLFFRQTLLFTAFLVTVLKILTFALVSTWSSVSSGYEHVPQLMQPWFYVKFRRFFADCRRFAHFLVLIFPR